MDLVSETGGGVEVAIVEEVSSTLTSLGSFLPRLILMTQ